MHIHPDHVGGHAHDHTHEHTHEHTHDGAPHSHPHVHEHSHEHGHPHTHDHLHDHGHEHHHDHQEHHHHEHTHDCGGNCAGCASQCEHTPMEELMALMQYMVGHNAAHARELADLAQQLQQAGSYSAYEQVMAAVSDFEKGNMRLSVVLSSLKSE